MSNYLSLLLYAMLLSCIYTTWCSTLISGMRNETDRLALISFKEKITKDPLGILNSWNNSHQFCQWPGIQCSSRHQHRVTTLNLQSYGLEGFISPHIGNLTFLRRIDLQNNSFHGEIPAEIGRLFRLQFLDLSNNSFEGQLANNLSRCADLRYLNLIDNRIRGRIPVEIGSLAKLSDLGLSVNNFTGSIPARLGNLSSLTQLSLGNNNLEGNIPESLGQIKSLRFLQLSMNKLGGQIPPGLYNLSTIDLFYVWGNQLEGSLSQDIGHAFPRLRGLALAENRFTGHVPSSLSNASKLEAIYLAVNDFTGPIPRDLGMLQNLNRLDMAGNKLGMGEGNDLDFINSLTNCTNLELLTFASNLLRGPLVSSIANLSTQITRIDFRDNQIYGSIASGISNLLNLQVLNMRGNYLASSIPADIGKLQKLQQLYFNLNKLSGKIPSSLGNLTLLIHLNLGQNNFSGQIPPELSRCQQLVALILSDNHLNGSIPKELMGLSSLSIGLNLSYNGLTGSIPLEVGHLINLESLDISNNNLSSHIPSTLGCCVKLLHLDLEGNFFNGEVPHSLTSLRGLDYIDLSHNKLSGCIAASLGELPYLTYLNLSFNEFSGEVPSIGVFKNATIVSLSGNYNLCGGIPEFNLPMCLSEQKGMRVGVKIVIIVVASILGSTMLAVLVIILRFKQNSKKNLIMQQSFNNHFPVISYSNLHKATEGFSESNLIGIGSYGSVYKGILDPEGTVVAVKVLNLRQRGASKSFMSECIALKNVRHRNLVKVVSACSSLDFQGNDFKALIFEFMPKGNLDQWLHPENMEDNSKALNVLQRLNIAIELASAMEYLHCHCHAIIVHSDLKPSNVLLSEEMTAHVGDFGLAKIISLLSDAEANQSSTTAIKGSMGYIAPEYGVSGNVSTKGDVYSYGILLLEMFIGRRPTDEMFKDGLTLHNFVDMSLPEQLNQVMDPAVLLEVQDNSGKMECCISVMRIGIKCSMERPADRMDMGAVVTELCSIRDAFLEFEGVNSTNCLLKVREMEPRASHMRSQRSAV